MNTFYISQGFAAELDFFESEGMQDGTGLAKWGTVKKLKWETKLTVADENLRGFLLAVENAADICADKAACGEFDYLSMAGAGARLADKIRAAI